MARTKQQLIAGFMDRLDPMVESTSTSSMSGLMGGGMGSTRDDATLDSGMGEPADVLVEPDTDTEMDGGEEGFTEFQIKVAKRFIEIMGGADKARAVVDKVDECEECLGIVDDDMGDENTIGQMAGMMPGSPDLPMELSNLYNQSAHV